VTTKIKLNLISIFALFLLIISYFIVMEIKADENAGEFIPSDKIIEDAGVDFPIDI